MIRPSGGVFLVDESRVEEYRAAGCRPADPYKAVSGQDTAGGRKTMKPLRKRKGLEITQ
jgi:hypothetical protein